MVHIKKICTDLVHVKVVESDHLRYYIIYLNHHSCILYVALSKIVGLLCEPEVVKITSFRARIKPYLSFTRKS